MAANAFVSSYVERLLDDRERRGLPRRLTDRDVLRRVAVIARDREREVIPHAAFSRAPEREKAEA
jgi:hypothetical protein